MTPDNEAATIAAALTKAQRDAVLGEERKGSVRSRLVKLGVMYLEPKPQEAWVKGKRYFYRLTPLGLEVRTLLQQEASHG